MSHNLMQFSVYGGISFVTALLLIMLLMQFFFVGKYRIMQKSILALEKKIHIVTSTSLGMGQRMLELESNIKNLRDLHDEFKHNDLNFSYSQANNLIEQGLNPEAVAANSGLSLSEVNLMELLYRERIKNQRVTGAA